MPPIVTVEAALRSAHTELEPSSPTPLLDAEILLGFITRRSRTQLRSEPERRLTTNEYARFLELVQRRRRGEPIAYLTGTREFWSLELDVNESVLVPRPETELIVERALFHMRTTNARVLDLGTGSGAIALAIAHERRLCSVLAIDASAKALDVAQHNARKHGLANLRFRVSNWFEAVERDERFDIVLSNPPYIAEGDPDLAADVLKYEPSTALIAGRTGFEAIEAIVSNAAVHLHEGGWLVVEHGMRQAAVVRRLLEQAGFTSVASHADLAGIERVSEGRWTHSRKHSD